MSAIHAGHTPHRHRINGRLVAVIVAFLVALFVVFMAAQNHPATTTDDSTTVQQGGNAAPAGNSLGQDSSFPAGGGVESPVGQPVQPLPAPAGNQACGLLAGAAEFDVASFTAEASNPTFCIIGTTEGKKVEIQLIPFDGSNAVMRPTAANMTLISKPGQPEVYQSPSFKRTGFTCKPSCSSPSGTMIRITATNPSMLIPAATAAYKNLVVSA